MRHPLRLGSLALAGALLLPGACASGRVDLGGPMRIQGRVMAAPEVLRTARVEVRRMQDGELSAPLPGPLLVPDGAGRFRTRLLGRGRYLLALRGPDIGLSTASVSVPHGPEVRLTARPRPAGPVVEVTAPRAGHLPLRVTATRDVTHVPAPERYEATAPAGRPVRVGSLSAGSWRLDVEPLGVTATLQVDGSEGSLEVEVDGPPRGTGEVHGRLIRIDGEPCEGAAVVVRPILAGAPGQPARLSTWGRYVVTGRDGDYRIEGLPAGPARVSVERREVLFRILPDAQDVEIPPSGGGEASFVVEP